MRRVLSFAVCRSPSAVLSLLFVALTTAVRAQSPVKPTVAQFLSPSSPQTVTAARKADRIAWASYEKGMRNVYTAAAPAFTPVKLTNFNKDDGVDLTDVSLSDDGSVAVFVHGSAPNRDDWVANPSHDPDGPERAIWAVRTAGGTPAFKVAVGAGPEVSPDGRFVLYVRDGQIYRARLSQTPAETKIDKGDAAFIREWGVQSNPRWSPDGSRILYVSNRVAHSFVALYDVASRTVQYVSPSVDFDENPQWSEDGKKILFTRRPGTPFGQQTQMGGGGIGFPQGPAFNGGIAAGRGGRGGGGAPNRTTGGLTSLNVVTPQSGGNLCGRGGGGGGAFAGGGRGGRGGGAGRGGRGGDSAAARGGGRGFGGARGAVASADSTPPGVAPAGLCNATFTGGYTLSIMTVDVANPKEAKEAWHNEPRDTMVANLGNIHWVGDNIVFQYTPPRDDFQRYYSLNVTNPSSRPVLLTTTNGLIEDATSVSFSRDGKTLFYCTNANDIEKRHIWAVPTTGGTPKRISTDDGIETYPQPLSSGKQVAVLYFDGHTPASVGLVPADGGATKVIFPKLGAEFPSAAHVTPEIVLTKAADGIEIHNQVFVPKDLKPGERRPAIVFVHGGPVRQMLPGYHYMQFYHWAYAFNEYLQSQGYIVMSINYRGGVGYGNAFRAAPGTNSRGNSEYQDVLAGAKYLQSRPDVDASRIGIWGLSYGGLLTSQALARNSDIFIAGADLAGVHLYTPTLDTSNVAYKSSSVSAIDSWKSPVLLVQGDDDRNVDFAQTIGLVDLLRAHGVYHELIVIPDDLHESMVHANWVYTFNRIGDFLHRFVWEKQTPPAAMSNGR